MTKADLLGSRQPSFSGTFSRVLAPPAQSADKVFADDGRRWDACRGPGPARPGAPELHAAGESAGRRLGEEEEPILGHKDLRAG